MHCISRRTYRLPPPFPAPQRQSLREQSGIVRMLPGLRLCDSSDRALSPVHPYRRRTESDGIFRRGRILSAYVPCRFRKLRHIFLRQEYMRRPSAATARPSGTKTPRYPPACCRTVENRSPVRRRYPAATSPVPAEGAGRPHISITEHPSFAALLRTPVRFIPCPIPVRPPAKPTDKIPGNSPYLRHATDARHPSQLTFAPK